MLLAYLAAHRDRPTARTQLLDDMWPDRAVAAAGATLSVVLSKVRALPQVKRVNLLEF